MTIQIYTKNEKPAQIHLPVFPKVNRSLMNIRSSKGMQITGPSIKFTGHSHSVMVSMLTSSVVDHWIDPRSGQTKDYEIGICCFSARHAALRSRRKRKDWLGAHAYNKGI
jgi:hypothetical protein